MQDSDQLDHKKLTLLKYDGSDENVEAIQAKFETLQAKDCVVLIQSNHFRLAGYRITMQLFGKQLKLIQHVHLGIIYESQYANYIEALAFSGQKSKPLATYLKSVVDTAPTAKVTCVDGSVMNYTGGFCPAKLNIGDYTDMKNVGGTYPIGEVFSENKNFEGVNGELQIYAFPNHDRELEFAEPNIVLRFKNSILTNLDELLESDDTPHGFKPVLARMNAAEGCVYIREFGLGLNPGMGRGRLVQDITAFERQIGMHVSLGKMHNVFNKKAYGIKPRKAWFHVDVFVNVKTIQLGETVIYDDCKYRPIPSTTEEQEVKA
jgi:hypothetical protein